MQVLIPPPPFPQKEVKKSQSKNFTIEGSEDNLTQFLKITGWKIQEIDPSKVDLEKFIIEKSIIDKLVIERSIVDELMIKIWILMIEKIDNLKNWWLQNQ